LENIKNFSSSAITLLRFIGKSLKSMKALSVCGFIANINFELLKVLSALYTSAQAEQFCDEKNLKKVFFGVSESRRISAFFDRRNFINFLKKL
jgi:hypothetical protein